MAGSGLKGPEGLGGCGSRGRRPDMGKVVGWGEIRGCRTQPGLLKSPGASCSHVSIAAAQAPASHPKYTCSWVSASLGWIRAQLWGPHPPGRG